MRTEGKSRAHSRDFCKKCNYGEPALFREKSTGNKMPLIFKTLKHFLPVWFVERHAVLVTVLVVASLRILLHSFLQKI